MPNMLFPKRLRVKNAQGEWVDVPAVGNPNGGTDDHRQLTNRDAANQHPISAVTGLTAALSAIPSPVDKTSAMTQPVGKDADGKLWTEPHKDHPYLSLERRGDYLYRVTFDTIPADNGASPIAGGACTSYVKDGKLYRNFDWNYNNAAEFEVICKGFRGIALIDGLTDGSLDDALIGQLPYHLADGRNDYGIMVSEHVLYNDWNWTGNGSTPMHKIPYILLSQIQTLEDFPEQIAELLDDLYVPQVLADAEYLLHYIVTDRTTTYCIMPPESSSGSYVCVDITENPKLANFRWVSDETVNREDLQDRPTGVERWNLIGGDTSISDLRFTKAYEEPTRLSEFIGINGTTKDSTDAELTAIYDLAHAAYLTRTRDGSTWQTMHSVVYSASGMEHLWVQEDWKRDYIGGGADLPSTTNLIAGDGSGGATDSGIAAGDVALVEDLEDYRTAEAQDEIDAGLIPKSAQSTKSAPHTKPVVIDSDGKLWTEPGEVSGALIGGEQAVIDEDKNIVIPSAGLNVKGVIGGNGNRDDFVFSPSLENRYMPKQYGAVRHNLATFGHEKDVVDSGISKNNLVLKKSGAIDQNMAAFVAGDVMDSGVAKTDLILATDPNAFSRTVENAVRVGDMTVLHFGGNVPTSADSDGFAGEIVCDSGYVYICIANDTWVKLAITNF